jgi:Fe-Mn family superoxide dismutase
MDLMPTTFSVDRRAFLKGAAMLGAAAILSHHFGANAAAADVASDAFSLPPLPFAEDALEPYISARTIAFHYGKHHRGYVDKLNRVIQNTPFVGLPLPAIIQKTSGHSDYTDIFNNAAQVWNHTFYWQSIKPGGGPPQGKIAERIKNQFGDLTRFMGTFSAVATGRFGSGWAWLAETHDGALKILSTPNADNPLTQDLTPLLTLDVWEHAYYLDYQNRRTDYIEACLAHLVNWDFASENLTR